MKKTLSIVVLFFSIYIHAQDYKSFPMWDPSLPIETRVNDVVSRLTLEEKVKQMLNATPAIPRLGHSCIRLVERNIAWRGKNSVQSNIISAGNRNGGNMGYNFIIQNGRLLSIGRKSSA
jgi:hypothetical protein